MRVSFKIEINMHNKFYCFRFNYRSTHYMANNGFYKFLNWFDDRAWYPLGRIVGGTVNYFIVILVLISKVNAPIRRPVLLKCLLVICIIDGYFHGDIEKKFFLFFFLSFTPSY